VTQLNNSAFIILKKTRSGGWKPVSDIKAELQNIVGFDEDFDWLDLLTVPDEAESFDLQIGNNSYLIVKFEKLHPELRMPPTGLTSKFK
jgi:hypothetical protein